MDRHDLLSFQDWVRLAAKILPLSKTDTSPPQKKIEETGEDFRVKVSIPRSSGFTLVG